MCWSMSLRRVEVETPLNVTRRQQSMGEKDVGGFGVLVEAAVTVKSRVMWST